MRSPPELKTVFVAWDHTVREHKAELQELITAKRTVHTYIARCAGGIDPDGPISQGLCADIRSSDCLLGFLEQPNCNVMFEAGYALGAGRPIYLRVYSEKTRPRWTEAAKWLHGLTIKAIPDAAAEADNLSRYDDAVAGNGYEAPLPAANGHPRVLTLCPYQNPGRTLRETIQSRLADLTVLNRLDGGATKQLQAVDQAARVGWVLPYLTLEDGHRDHPENAANAFFAGYALGKGKSLKLFQQTGVRLRTLLDLTDVADHPWFGVRDLPDVIQAAWSLAPDAT